MESLTDEKIMLEVKNGKKEYFNMILDRYYKTVLNYAFRITGNRGEAEDVTQETFSKIYFAAKRYQPLSSFKAFLYTIAFRECLKSIGKRKNIIELSSLHEPKSQDNPVSTLENKEKAMIVKNALLKLKPIHRSALILREYQNLSYEEISQVLKCSLAATKNYIFRSKEQLKNILKPILSRGAL